MRRKAHATYFAYQLIVRREPLVGISLNKTLVRLTYRIKIIDHSVQRTKGLIKMENEKTNKLSEQIKRIQELYNECKNKDKNIAIGWKLSGGNID